MKLKDEYLKARNKISADLKEYPQLLKDYEEALHLKTLAKAQTIISQYKEIQEAKDSLDEAKNNRREDRNNR